MSKPRVESLGVVLPALNEELALAAMLDRCLAAEQNIRMGAGIDTIEWLVVNDGSTDKTGEIADRYATGHAQIRVLHFPKNQGYGAAIQKGFDASSCSMLAFLDADGTCDPKQLGEMCAALQRSGGDLVIGSRMVSKNAMPLIRRWGNRFYAILLGFLTGRRVSDAASGMRVMRRESWQMLKPLPTGLHFTPAMSAKALAADMEVLEIPIHYAERIGQSKLNLFRDGVRFLQAIFLGILSARPDRLLSICFVAFCLGIAIVGAYPTEFYLRHGRLEEWMIYRFFACYVMAHAAFTFLCAIVITHKAAKLGPSLQTTNSFYSSFVARFFEWLPLLCWSSICVVLILLLVGSGLIEYFTFGTVDLHWSRVFIAAYLMAIIIQAFITSLIVNVIEIWGLSQPNSVNAT